MGNIYTLGGGTALYKQSYMGIKLLEQITALFFLKMHLRVAALFHTVCAVGLDVNPWFIVLRVVVFLAFFCHNSSQILLLCLSIDVFHPVGMGVFHHWSCFQTHFACV